MRFHINFNLSKKLLSSILIILILIASAVFIYIERSNKNPLPANIKDQINYRAIYPSSTDQIDQSSYKFQVGQSTLSFKVNDEGTNIVFTEQPAPSSVGSGTQSFYPSLGLHPYAQFQTKLGTVALIRFYQTGNLHSLGQSAVLASNGTLLIAHSDKNLTNTQWKDLFDNLKISK